MFSFMTPPAAPRSGSRAAVTTPRALRWSNAAEVLRYALRVQEFNTNDAMEAVGLSRATVLAVCGDLIGGGWLQDVTDPRPGPHIRSGVDTRSGPYTRSGSEPVATTTAERKVARGRPALRYRLRPDVGVITGLDAGEFSFTVVVADLRGTVMYQVSRPVPGRDLDGNGRVELARAMIADALSGAGPSHGPNLLTSVAVAAPVDRNGTSPVGNGRYWPVMNPGYVARLEGHVMVENDANLAALAEHVRADEADLATLLADEQLGAGLVVDGRLMRGTRGGAGELRFLQMMVAPGTNAGMPTTTGLGRMAVAWARESLARDNRPSTLRTAGGGLTATQVLVAAAKGDPVATEVAHRLGERLAQIALVLESVTDIRTLVVAGNIAPHIGPVIDQAREVLTSRYHPPYPDFVASTAGPHVVALGAMEAALDRIRDDPLPFRLLPEKGTSPA
jgi:predicted NBD/HSP70 family sugar kinase